MYLFAHAFHSEYFGKSKEPSGQPNLPLMHYFAVYTDNIVVVPLN